MQIINPDNFGDFLDMLRRFIQLEMQLGDEFQIQVFTEATPYVSFGAVEPLDRILFLLITAHNADIHSGILEVVAQLDPGNGHEADTGILQTMLNQFGDFLMDQFLDSL